MAEKLERKVMEIYGENAATRDIIAYGSDIAGNIVETKDPNVIQTEAYKTGVRSAVVGNNSTTLQNRQALDFLFSRQLKYLYQHGVAEWGADETYFVNSFAVGSNGTLYVSLTDNNKGNNPTTDTTNWQAFPTPAQLAQKVAKAGDTMTGQLVMENGSNGIRFNGSNSDNFYYVKAGNGGIYQYNKENQGSILSTPVGSLIMGPIPEAQTPSGYLFCNGQAVSRTTYSALFNVLGTNFGEGDGSTTFNIPDYRNCFLRGLGTENNSFYVKQSQGLPEHAHKEFNTAYNNYGTPLTSAPDSYVAAAGMKRDTTDRDDYNLMVSVGNPVTPNAGNTGNASVSNSIYGASSEVRPVNYAINYFIKY